MNNGCNHEFTESAKFTESICQLLDKLWMAFMTYDDWVNLSSKKVFSALPGFKPATYTCIITLTYILIRVLRLECAVLHPCVQNCRGNGGSGVRFSSTDIFVSRLYISYNSIIQVRI